MPVNINCDMGESFGLYKMGDDEAMMPLITEANVACGFHGSDPNHMRSTVDLAKRFGVGVGAHFSLPDLLKHRILDQYPFQCDPLRRVIQSHFYCRSVRTIKDID